LEEEKTHSTEHHAHKEHHAAQHKVHTHHPKKKVVHTRKKKKPLAQYIFGAVVFVVLVAVVVGIIYLSTKAGESRIERQDEIAAVVNDEPITTAYLDEQYSRVPEMYRQFITKMTLLNQTISEVILLQEAETQGIAVSEEEIQQEIENAMAAAGVTEEQLEERLAEQNITRELLEELYMKQLTINNLLEEVVFSEMEVTAEEVEVFYNSQVHAMHILVETEEEALEIIEDLKEFSLKRIEAGFSDIAKEKSIDPSAEVNGGDLGEFGKGQMVPEFEEAAFALEEYAFNIEPVQSQFGYHIILRLPKAQTLEEQRDAIEEALLNQKKAQAVPLYVEQLRSNAHVEVFYEEEIIEPAPLALPEPVFTTETSEAPVEEPAEEPAEVEPVETEEPIEEPAYFYF
jgi:parvulin-like peptidyl-prolyl isomerase